MLVPPGCCACEQWSPNADHGLAAGVPEDGNPGQCVLQRTVIFVQLHL